MHLRIYTIGIVLFTLIFAAISLSAARHPVAKNEAKWQTIDDIVNAPNDNFDLAYALLYISQKSSREILNRDFDVQESLHQIDSLTILLQNRLANARNPEETINILNHFIFTVLGFTTDESDTTGRDPKNLFINDVFERRKGYCLSLSLPYLIFADRLNLPLFGVASPGHFFVRYDDGETQIVNIETTAGGRLVSNNYYREKHQINGNHVFYMQNLTKRQVIGVFLNNLGNCYRRAKMLQEAHDILQAAITIHPGHPEAHTNLGNVLYEMNNTDAAILEHKRALQLYPYLAEAYTNLGSVYDAKGMIDEAQKAHLNALEIRPDLTGAYINLGNIYLKKGDYKAALGEYEVALFYDSTLAIAHANMGSAYDKMGILSKALIAYKKAIEINPRLNEAWLNLGNLYTQLGILKDAATTYEKAISINQDNLELQLSLANTYRDLKNNPKAITAYHAALKINPQFALAYYNLGLLYSKNPKTTNQAIQAYKGALKYDDSFAEAHLNLGSLYQQEENNFYRAEKHFRRALVLRPDFTEANFNMGV
ncbi:MAG: tetratricopeptide repeat protein, partial [Deferribacteres bacterium]|nr:tetratricopeptide repeat protein [Deferribacteres bacterium]